MQYSRKLCNGRRCLWGNSSKTPWWMNRQTDRKAKISWVRGILSTSPTLTVLQIIWSTDTTPKKKKKDSQRQLVYTATVSCFPCKQPLALLCCNMAAACLRWCEASLYSGHGHKQSRRAECSRRGWQLFQNVLSVHWRYPDLTNRLTSAIKSWDPPTPPPPPINPLLPPLPLHAITAVATKGFLGKAPQRPSLPLRHVFSCWLLKIPGA